MISSMSKATKNTSKILVVLSFCALSACSDSYHADDFNCGPVQGSSCQSISDADKGTTSNTRSLVLPKNGNTTKPYDPAKRNKFRDLFFDKKISSSITNPEWPTDAENAKLGLAPTSRNLPSSRYNPQLQRIEERLGTLWVASYLDGDNVLHDASYVHFVINNARWAGAE